MNRLKKYLTGLLLALLAISLSLPMAKADKVKIKPVFTYGESLSPSQYDQTKSTLGVKNGSKEIEVKVNELNSLLQDSYPYYQCYSSTYITPADNKGKVTVEILTPQTITTITPLQYENAALTAGAVDVDIKVASAVEVDGSGALAGVYKAFADQGYKLSDQAVSTAQDELNTTAQITKDNKDKDGYSDEQLNTAIADMKTQIQKEKEKSGGTITADQINIIVNNVLNNYNLNGVLSQDNINALKNMMQRFSQLELSDEQKNAISDFGKNLLEQGSQALDSAQTAWDNMDEEQKSGITAFFQSIGDFFVNLFNSLIDLIQGLVNG